MSIPPFRTNLFGQERDDISEDRLRTLEGRLATAEASVATLQATVITLDAKARGYVAGDLASINSTSAMALSKTATEAVFMTSNAIATTAGRRYKITAMIHTNPGGSWNWAGLRVRRGATTGGTQIAVAYYDRPVGAGAEVPLWVIAYDVPGAQAAQQWCMTHQLDTSICDLYAPSFIAVEDVGT